MIVTFVTVHMASFLNIYMPNMRKTLVILLVSIHLGGNTEVGQLLRAPQLISHYFQHHRQNSSISFIDFIAMHYGGDDGTSADDDFDSKLPCHNINHNTLSLAFSPMVKDVSPVAASQAVQPDHNSRLVVGISSKHVLLILQPPRA